MPTGIVGATGFIGSYLCHQSGVSPLRILTRSVGKIPSGSFIEVVHGDLRSQADCERFAAGLDVIYYLAHTNSPVNSDKDQPADAALNLVPFLNLLSTIRRLGAKPHVVYFSSGGGVYASSAGRVPYREADLCAPSSSYGILKLTAEQYLRLAAERGELTATVLRVANAYGTLLPQCRRQGLIGVALNQVLHNEPVRIFGNPENIRDYVHLHDVRTMVERASVPRRPFDIVNVGSGRGHSVIDVLDIMRQCHGSPFPVQQETGSATWLPDWVVLDHSYARAEYGWAPTISLHEGIAAMFEASTGEWLSQVAVAR